MLQFYRSRWFSPLMVASSVLLFLAAIAPCPVAAEKLYKYRDASGKWIFSDRPVSGLKPVEIRQIRLGQRHQRVTLRPSRSGEDLRLAAINELHGPAEVEITLPDANNVVSTPSLPLRRIVPGATEVTLAMLRPADPAQPYDPVYRMRFVPGDPSAKHNPRHPYLVPFASGARFRVSQGFSGKTSHQGPASRYAVDISMPQGTPIRAARDGVVMDVAFDYFEGGLDREQYGGRANLVRILHDDGTMAVYVHLRLESVRFPIGARVKAGAVIAESGNTGYTSGPHLHFAVQRNAGLLLVSEPFQFAAADGRGATPKSGDLLTAR
jgi:murein DD-endopeptidase MepM/ murein hydrolase activator NlpD